MERPESIILPARRSQWLVSALAYAFGLDQGIENEVVVLATGIDQYIQEIFHHLDILGKDRIHLSDFNILLEVIGFKSLSPLTEESEESGTVGDQSKELSFKEFHSKLVQCFLGEDGNSPTDESYSAKRWDNADKFVEAEVRVVPRSGLSIRTMCTECFQKRPLTEVYHSVMYKQGRLNCVDGMVEADSHMKSDFENITLTPDDPANTGNDLAMTKLQQENEGLREIIEDMRQALQSSDARHLALLVSLQKLKTAARENQTPFPPLPPKLPGHSSIRPQNAVTLARELSRLREDRDNQLEEAICYTQSLEADLWQSKKNQTHLEQSKSFLLGKQQSLTQRLCSARETLSSGLERVRELEKQVEGIDNLQSKLTEWKNREREKTECSAKSPDGFPHEDPNGSSDVSGGTSVISGGTSVISGGSLDDSSGTSEDSGGDLLTGMDSGCVSDNERGSPTSAGSETDSSSVASGSISDEDSVWQEEDNKHNNNNNNNNCASSSLTGVLNNADWLIKLTQVQKHLLETEVQKGQAEGQFKQIKADLLHELNTKLKETEQYQTEIQCLETERVRLSLIEATVGEVISLLRKLRNLNLSRRSAGKILMDTLEVCLKDNYNSDSENEVRSFLNFLHKQLMHHDLLRLNGISVRGTQSTPNSPEMRRSAAAAGGSVRLSTDFYQFNSSTSKKLCREASAESNDVEDMVCNGNMESPTEI
ncbi:EF-hand and coiled-coil domain-containing protein 1-like [Asterias amurensis]|uniref:EF-hand and coiled-coil domain-containing protein 1-like n=1 Tax=Asterias amurensis TaxID=7602 RepID=UPI003AB60D78